MHKALACAAGMVLIAMCEASAHHSFAAEFDGRTPVTLRGTIVKLEWVNPHCQLWIDVRGAGRDEHWGFEMPPPNALVRRGVRREMFTPGDEITATVFPARDGRTFASAQTFVLKSGQFVVLGPPGTKVPGEPAGKR